MILHSLSMLNLYAMTLGCSSARKTYDFTSSSHGDIDDDSKLFSDDLSEFSGEYNKAPKEVTGRAHVYKDNDSSFSNENNESLNRVRSSPKTGSPRIPFFTSKSLHGRKTEPKHHGNKNRIPQRNIDNHEAEYYPLSEPEKGKSRTKNKLDDDWDNIEAYEPGDSRRIGSTKKRHYNMKNGRTKGTSPGNGKENRKKQGSRPKVYEYDDFEDSKILKRKYHSDAAMDKDTTSLDDEFDSDDKMLIELTIDDDSNNEREGDMKPRNNSYKNGNIPRKKKIALPVDHEDEDPDKNITSDKGSRSPGGNKNPRHRYSNGGRPGNEKRLNHPRTNNLSHEKSGNWKSDEFIEKNNHRYNKNSIHNRNGPKNDPEMYDSYYDD